MKKLTNRHSNSGHTYKDINEYFKQHYIMVLSITSAISLLSIVVRLIIYNYDLNDFFIFIVSGISNFFYSVCFFMFYFKALKNNSLKLPSSIFYWFQLLSLMVVSIIIILCLVSTIMTNNIILTSALLFIGMLFIGSYFIQFTFSRSIRKYVEDNVKMDTGLKFAQIFNYIYALIILAQLFSINTKYIDIIMIFTTSICFVFKGIIIREYKRALEQQVGIKQIND